MPHAFVDITSDLASALASGPVLTSNDRLRRDLIRSYDLHQQRQGKRVWPSPSVFSLSGWWLQLYQRAADEDAACPELLSRERAYLLFRELAPEGAADLSGQALAAWDQVQQWSIPLDEPGLGSTEDSRLFARWARQVRDTLTERQQVTASQLGDLQALDACVGNGTITCLEFESPTTQIRRWQARMESLGLPVEMLNQPPQTSCAAVRYSFADLDEELSAAAIWARSLLEQQQSADELRIGIVIPDLGPRHQQVVRRFSAEFSPLGQPSQAQPFDIGGGGSLAEQPVWQVARDWLELCYRNVSSSSLQRMHQSKYLNLPELPAELPETLENISLANLARALGSKQLQELAGTLTTRSQSLPAWLREFRVLLNHAGWHAGSAGSLQYQAYQQLCRLLDELGHGSTGRPLDCTVALDELQATLSLRLFAPLRDPAPIQILGYLETTGLSFSHLWLTGMDEDTWPAASSSNPLLPLAVCRKYGLPRSTPAEELAFAAGRLAHWQHCSETLIVSHPRQRGERQVGISPLLRELPADDSFALPVLPHPYFQAQPQLEVIADDYGNPLAAGLIRGGTGLFAEQAGCPFRAWAINRLGLAEPRLPHAFPDPLDRGRLFHGALQLLYQPHVGESGPIAFTQSEINGAVRNSIERYYQRYPEAFLDRERERLLQVVTLWLELEETRSAFVVEAVETSREVTLGDVRINLRVDRLDRIADVLIITDYKTGAISLPATDGFLLEPQLPIYAMTDDRIEGVFYAQLDDAKPRMSGIAATDVDMGAIRVTPARDNSWATQVAAWRLELLGLASEISAGYAAVLPRRQGICDRCHLAGLCRIDEQREVW